jgi:hypothetical protein
LPLASSCAESSGTLAQPASRRIAANVGSRDARIGNVVTESLLWWFEEI